MDTSTDLRKTSTGILWTSYIISAIPVSMMIFSAVLKFFPSVVAEGFNQLGWPVTLAPILGIIELGCVIVYLFPRTAVLGAILIAGYLGGATATHVRVGDGFFFAPFILGVLAWLGLWLREPRLKALLPFRS
jgi:hypothetical protein